MDFETPLSASLAFLNKVEDTPTILEIARDLIVDEVTVAQAVRAIIDSACDPRRDASRPPLPHAALTAMMYAEKKMGAGFPWMFRTTCFKEFRTLCESTNCAVSEGRLLRMASFLLALSTLGVLDKHVDVIAVVYTGLTNSTSSTCVAEISHLFPALLGPVDVEKQWLLDSRVIASWNSTAYASLRWRAGGVRDVAKLRAVHETWLPRMRAAEAFLEEWAVCLVDAQNAFEKKEQIGSANAAGTPPPLLLLLV
jgi:hypothetical protein